MDYLFHPKFNKIKEELFKSGEFQSRLYLAKYKNIHNDENYTLDELRDKINFLIKENHYNDLALLSNTSIYEMTEKEALKIGKEKEYNKLIYQLHIFMYAYLPSYITNVNIIDSLKEIEYEKLSKVTPQDFINLLAKYKNINLKDIKKIIKNDNNNDTKMYKK